MAFSREAFTDEPSRGYVESRNIEDIKNRLGPTIRRWMSQHLNLIKDGAKGFSQLHTEIHSTLTRDLGEKVETSELIIRQIVDDILPGALDLVSQISQLADQWPSQVAPEAVMACDDDGFRSLTMDLELGSSNHRHGGSSMGPPPRPTALPTPVTPGAPRDNVEDAREPPPPIEEDRESVHSDTSLVSISLLQTAKRSLDVAEMDHPGSPELPASRAKSSTARPLWGLVTNSVDFQEIEGNQFIFQDKRYGDGWLALWCDRDKQQPPFLEHPFRTKVAFDHFNGSGHACHGSDRRPELEEILRECTYHAPKVNYPHGELTEPMVRNANYKLKKKYGKPKGSARKSRKGKQRAGPARSTPYFRASTAETSETDVTYQTETVGVTEKSIAEFQAGD